MGVDFYFNPPDANEPETPLWKRVQEIMQEEQHLRDENRQLKKRVAAQKKRIDRLIVLLGEREESK